MEFSSVDEIEYLHHHKCIEDEGKMPWILSSGFKDFLIILISGNLIETPASNKSSDDSIMPLVFRMSSKNRIIISIYILRNYLFSGKDESHHNN